MPDISAAEMGSPDVLSALPAAGQTRLDGLCARNLVGEYLLRQASPIDGVEE
jgi:hypothetical protein